MRIRHWDICAGHSEYGSIKIVKCLTWNKKHQRLTAHIFVTLRANGRNKSQNCWATMMGVVTSVCTWLNFWPVSNFAQQLPTTLNNIQQGVQTASTCNIQQCWELLANNVASVCTGLKTNENNNRNKSARLPIKQWFKCPICLSTEFKIRISILIHSRNIEEREEELGKSTIDDMVKDVGKKYNKNLHKIATGHDKKFNVLYAAATLSSKD